jgi:hypothetical protein|mmetsp:Transcript_963/g.1794  ORF Transcript_963/g.1794 Transcript_963/m.1794 type:complete len:250 (-) Transcript_963:229-978(-)|eukprot:CAMPEP_0198284936 /NCGR_PEP_ID=MMETSP1449-20131203/4295_1 /TAXON_ID=420275 /ORGANISM="Attheya septentrionalis, Strain CCMP2084" /LENGTH=249 /DNA_ID=CAMNT_0043982157 /DNA_START=108 /DNA_END=857 /DNA_ORIENTATION=-
MTASEVVHIAGTVAVVQVVIDLLTRYMVFQKEPYQQSVVTLERMRAKRDKALALAESSKATSAATNKGGKLSGAAEKNAKKAKFAQDDFHAAAADVARRHTRPGMLSSLFFFILYRVLSAEYDGKVVAVLPFVPWPMLRRLSTRGLILPPQSIVTELLSTVQHDPSSTDGVDSIIPAVTSPQQACSFLFIYMLCTFSVKFIMGKIFAKKPPAGADRGLGTMLENPNAQKFLSSMGVDPDELNEARKGIF